MQRMVQVLWQASLHQSEARPKALVKNKRELAAADRYPAPSGWLAWIQGDHSQGLPGQREIGIESMQPIRGPNGEAARQNASRIQTDVDVCRLKPWSAFKSQWRPIVGLMALAMGKP
ncbi:hypothetical protein LIA77_04452 [Sarocladium implicatum]|nr:hypothetical protein LIA77_04452 [Sarocladium implicatum]